MKSLWPNYALYVIGSIGLLFVVFPLLSTINFLTSEFSTKQLLNFGDPCRPSTVVLTILYVFFTVFGQMILGIVGALFVYFWSAGKLWKIVLSLSIFILPYSIPSTLGYSLFDLLLGQGSIIQEKLFSPLSPMNGTWSRFAVMIVVGVWQFFPFVLILILAAFLSVPTGLIKAAKLDGANNWRIFHSLLFPISLPVIFAAVAIRLVLMMTKLDAPLAFSITGSNEYTCVAGVQLYNSIGRSYIPLGLILSLAIATALVYFVGWYIARHST